MKFEQFLADLDTLSFLEALEICDEQDEDWIIDYVPSKFSEKYSLEFEEKWKVKISNLTPDEWLEFLTSYHFDFLPCDEYFCDLLLTYLQNNLCEENCHVLAEFSSNDYMILSSKGPEPEYDLHDFVRLDFTKNLLKKDNHTVNELTFLKSIIFEAYEYDGGLNLRNTDSSTIFKIAEIMMKNNHRDGLDKLASVCIWGDPSWYRYHSGPSIDNPLEDLLKKINGKLGTTYTVLSDRERWE